MKRIPIFLLHSLLILFGITPTDTYAQFPFWMVGGGCKLEEISPDGKFMLKKAESDYHSYRYSIWETATGKYIATIGDFDGDSYYFTKAYRAMFTPDSKHVVIYGVIDNLTPPGKGKSNALFVDKGIFSLDSLRIEHYSYSYTSEQNKNFWLTKVGNRLAVSNGSNGFYLLNLSPPTFEIDSVESRIPINMSGDGRFYFYTNDIAGSNYEVYLYYRNIDSTFRIYLDTINSFSTSLFVGSKYLVILNGYDNSLPDIKLSNFAIYTLSPDSARKLYSRSFPCNNTSITYRTVGGKQQLITCTDSSLFHIIDIESGSVVREIYTEIRSPEKIYCHSDDTLLVSTKNYPYLHNINLQDGGVTQINWSHDLAGEPIIVTNSEIASSGGFVLNRWKLNDLSHPSQQILYDSIGIGDERYRYVQFDSSLSHKLYLNIPVYWMPDYGKPVLKNRDGIVDSCQLSGSIIKVFPHYNLFLLNVNDSLVLFSYDNGKFVELDRFALAEKNIDLLTLELSRNGKYLCIGEGPDSLQVGTINRYMFRVYNVYSKSIEHQFTSPDLLRLWASGSGNYSAISSDGFEIALSIDGNSYRLNANNGELIEGKNDFGEHLYYSNDNTKIYSMTNRNPFSHITIYSVMADSIVARCMIRDADGYYRYDGFASFDISPDEKYIAVQTNNGSVACFKNPVDTTLSSVKYDYSEPQQLRVFSNPANESTNVNFFLNSSDYIKLLIVDPITCNEKIVFDGMLDSGTHVIPIDLQTTPNGIYLIVCEGNPRTYTKLIVNH